MSRTIVLSIRPVVLLIAVFMMYTAYGAPTLYTNYRAESTSVDIYFSLDSPKTGTVTCGAFTDGNANIIKKSECKATGGTGSAANCDSGVATCIYCTASTNAFVVTYTTTCSAGAQIRCDTDLAFHNDKNSETEPNPNLHSKNSVNVYETLKKTDYSLTLNQLAPGITYDVWCTMGNDATSAFREVTTLSEELSGVSLTATDLTSTNDPGDLFFRFIVNHEMVAQDTIKITQSSTNSHIPFNANVYTANDCNIYVNNKAEIGYTSTFSTPLLTLTLAADSDLPIARGSEVTVKCSVAGVLTNNPAAGGTVVPFNLDVKYHTALTGQFGYITTAVTQALQVPPTLVVDDLVIGNTPTKLTLKMQLDSSVALAAGHTVYINPNKDIFVQDGATTCTAKIDDDGSGTSEAAVAVESIGVVSNFGSDQKLLVVLAGAAAQDKYFYVECTDNLKPNVAGSVTFGLTLSKYTTLSAQTGYTTV